MNAEVKYQVVLRISRIYGFNKKNLEQHFYHTSLEVFDQEYSYSKDGITVAPLKPNPKATQLTLGHTYITKEKFSGYVDALPQIWTKKKYDALNNNCIHFSQMLVTYLKVDDLPKYLNQLPEQVKEFLEANKIMWIINIFNTIGGSGPTAALIGASAVCASKSSGLNEHVTTKDVAKAIGTAAVTVIGTVGAAAVTVVGGLAWLIFH